MDADHGRPVSQRRVQELWPGGIGTKSRAYSLGMGRTNEGAVPDRKLWPACASARANLLRTTLFGGGQAKLELLGDEILDTGLQVFAQPPGKKNTTIQLLSGGEKALTALLFCRSLTTI